MFVFTALAQSLGVVCTGNSTTLAVSECKAWQALHDSTNGPAWLHGCSNLRDDPCSCAIVCMGLVIGVKCNAGHITAINLFENGLTGSIPDAMTSMTYLEDWEMAGNQLNGTLPALSGFTRLVEFDMAGNALTGSLPGLGANMKVLRTLSAWDNKVSMLSLQLSDAVGRADYLTAPPPAASRTALLTT